MGQVELLLFLVRLLLLLLLLLLALFVPPLTHPLPGLEWGLWDQCFGPPYSVFFMSRLQNPCSCRVKNPFGDVAPHHRPRIGMVRENICANSGDLLLKILKLAH
ncbi:hypothetical protein LX36DRAFT_87602 [Colletotrichum falcatum]|nr:hypothetical protein LX36DRAFT_87602 [Colletotrichum falcatum]